jgi:AbiV family abortive infection protein
MVKAEDFSRTSGACFENGKKLLEDAKLLFDWERFPTALALSILAQEEFAKSFLLDLVVEGALPWLPEVQRSMARHECKHLIAVAMEWIPSVDSELFREQWKRKFEWYGRLEQRDYKPDPNDPDPTDPYFPDDVATALNIYRHEKIERLGSRHPWRDEDWSTGEARKIAEGSLDQKEQSGFYVDVTETGEIGMHPDLVTREDASEAINRAEHFSEGAVTYSDEYEKVREAVRHIFSSLTKNK